MEMHWVILKCLLNCLCIYTHSDFLLCQMPIYLCSSSLHRTPWVNTATDPLFKAQLKCSPSPGSLPDPRIEPRFPVLQADSLLSEPQGKLHSSTHFPPINSNSSFQLLRPKCWESSLTLFSPDTTFDLAANATGSIFKIYPTLTLSHDLHIYEHCCVPPSPPAWTAYRGLLNWSSWSAPTLSLLQSSLSTAARTILFQQKADFINSLFHPRSSTISPTTSLSRIIVV